MHELAQRRAQLVATSPRTCSRKWRPCTSSIVKNHRSPSRTSSRSVTRFGCDGRLQRAELALEARERVAVGARERLERDHLAAYRGRTPRRPRPCRPAPMRRRSSKRPPRTCPARITLEADSGGDLHRVAVARARAAAVVSSAFFRHAPLPRRRDPCRRTAYVDLGSRALRVQHPVRLVAAGVVRLATLGPARGERVVRLHHAIEPRARRRRRCARSRCRGGSFSTARPSVGASGGAPFATSFGAAAAITFVRCPWTHERRGVAHPALGARPAVALEIDAELARLLVVAGDRGVSGR